MARFPIRRRRQYPVSRRERRAYPQYAGPRRSPKARILIAFVLVVMALFTYWSQRQENPFTGETQSVVLSVDDEIALGLQAVPEMMQQHRGLHPDQRAQDHVDRIGQRLLAGLERDLAPRGIEIMYPFEFHLLADEQLINAFALPGGQVFITAALYSRLETEGQIAGVIGHEIGHVLSRHGNERLAKQNLTAGLAGAAGVAAGDAQSAQLAQAIGQMVNMKYGRDDELESDRWGVRLAVLAGYDPRAMFGVMKVLEEASGGGGQPEFLSTHPKPANRVAYVQQVIAEEFPSGLPEGLEP